MTSRMPHKSSFGYTGSPYNMLFASLLLHVIVIAAVIMTVPGASRQLTFGAPYSVALVGPEVIQSPQEAAGLKKLLQPAQPAHPVILKRNPVTSKAVSLIKKDETGKPDIEKALSAIRKKELSSVESNKTSKTPGAATTSSTENQSKTDDYSRFVWSKIKKNWTLPAALMPKNNVETIIVVRITQSGALEYIGFEKRSGNQYFDESALRAIKKSVPFPPLAGWVAERSIEIGIRFHSSELR
jgi:colicin import membrane protein